MFLTTLSAGTKTSIPKDRFFKKIVLEKCTISKITLRGEAWAADKGRNLIICCTQHIYLCSEIRCDCPLILGLNLQPRLPWTITRCPVILASLSTVPSFILKRDAVWAVSYTVTLLKIFKWVIPWTDQLWVRCYEIESKDFQAGWLEAVGQWSSGWAENLTRTAKEGARVTWWEELWWGWRSGAVWSWEDSGGGQSGMFELNISDME